MPSSSAVPVLHGVEGLAALPPGAVVTVGNFDGVHRGHAAIRAAAREVAGRLGPGAGTVAAVSFDPHPLTVLAPGRAPTVITRIDRRAELLHRAGADHVVVLPPSPEVLGLEAQAFWDILARQARISGIVEGPTFVFGKGRGGTIDRLAQWSRRDGVELRIVEPFDVALLDCSLVPVSSTLVRWLIAHGRVRDAAICLGRPVRLEGRVVTGFQRGRTIGIPTANLDIDGLAAALGSITGSPAPASLTSPSSTPSVLTPAPASGDPPLLTGAAPLPCIPADGVYAGRATVDGVTYAAAVSIGNLPTFQTRAWQVEAHLIGFSGDLYGRHLAIDLLDFLREQWKFPGIEALKHQIARDIAQCAARARLAPERQICRPVICRPGPAGRPQPAHN